MADAEPFCRLEVCTEQTCSASCCCLPRCSGVYALQGFSAPSPISIMPRSLDTSDTSLSESIKGDHYFKETLNSCNLPSVGHRQIFAVKVLPCRCNQTSLINFLTTAISPFSQSGLVMLLPNPEELLVARVWSVTKEKPYRGVVQYHTNNFYIAPRLPVAEASQRAVSVKWNVGSQKKAVVCLYSSLEKLYW